MLKLIVIGDKDSIFGFASAGIETKPVKDDDDIAKLIGELAQSGYAVIYIVEQLYEKIHPQLEEYSEMPIPTIIPIPGVVGNSGIGIAQVKKSVERAVGSDILFGSDK